MASAEARASYAANRCFTQDFRMRPNLSGHPSSTSEDLGSDSVPSNPVSVDSDCMTHSLNMKWWLHVKTNMGNEPNYTRKHVNSWEAELGAFCGQSVDDNGQMGGDQSVKTLDAFSSIGSANSVVKQPWTVSQTCMKNDTNTGMSKLEAAQNYDSQKTYKKKDEGELLFSDGHLMEWDMVNYLASEQCKTTSSDLESDWIGTEKAGPWWRTAGKDGLASFVAQKSLEHMENCDLPRPQVKHFRKNPSVSPKCVDHDEALPASANPTAEMSISSADSYTYGTTTSYGCSLQNSDTTFSQSKDSDPITKDGRMNSRNKTTSELLEALCHSQTRAREAEKAAQQAYNEKEHILTLFFRQASQLFAYKQWLQLLQLENLCLQLRNKNQPLLNLLSAAHRGKELGKSHCRAAKRKKKKNSKRRHEIRKCAVAFAVGLGLAGAGLLLGWTMGWMFPIYR